jgi:diaminopimelate decarboxylase
MSSERPAVTSAGTRPAGEAGTGSRGLDTASLVTPGYVYSAGVIRRQYARLAAALAGYRVCYSLKANPYPAIVRLLCGQGAGAEVSSAGELATALAAGVAPGDIIFVAPAKLPETARRAVAAGIHAVVCDGPEDLELLEKAARDADRDTRLLLRINTNECPAGREKMVGGPSKFGFDEEEVVAQARGARLERCRIAGIQVYSASQVLDAEQLAGHFDYVADLARRLAGELGIGLETVDFGGGFGLPYGPGEAELDLAAVGVAAARARGRLAADFPGCRLLVESGRFLVAEAGVFLTRVVRVKRSRGRTIVITDGGMNAFSRPVVMRVQHQVRLVNKPDRPATVTCDICGPICTPIDCLARDVRLPEPEPGDVVGIANAGAYGYSMSLVGFMSLGAPAESLLDE